MPYFKLTDEEKNQIVLAANRTPEDLFSLIEKILEDTLDWKPGRWWTVLDKNKNLWCETSSEEEARREHENKKGSTLHREYMTDQFSKLVKVED